METGRRGNFSDATLAAIEAVLMWEPGSARRVVEGGKPRRAVDESLARILEVWPVLSPDARVLLAEFAERAARER